MSLQKKFALICASAILLTSTGCGNKVSTADPSPSVPAETTGETVTTTRTETTTSALTTTVTTSPQPPADLLLRGLDTVEANADITLADFIIEKNVELSEGDALLDTTELGQHEAVVRYKSGGTEFEEKLVYTVKDTTPPLILNGGWSPVHVRGKAFDLNNYIGYADNFDRHPKMTYTGTVDTNRNGSYPLSVTVTDSSGNDVSWELTVKVADSDASGPDTTPRTQFSDFRTKYAGEGRSFGIDVSAWQGNIDFEQVKNAGAEFVFIRIGYYYSHVVMDDYFKANLKKAKDAGLKVGIYIYTTDNTPELAREHARWIAEQLGDTKLELPVAYDWEEFGGFQQYGMSIRDLNEIYLAFADEINKLGYDAMLYSSKNFLNNFWSERIKAKNPVWLAHFVNDTDYTGKYWIWQASCWGKIPGIAGDVDMNIMYNA